MSGLYNRNVPFHWARGIFEISNGKFCRMPKAPQLSKKWKLDDGATSFRVSKTVLRVHWKGLPDAARKVDTSKVKILNKI